MFLLGQTVGKYQILANLGSGGFGTVFLARDTWIDKKVAIKVPHRQTGEPDDLLQEPRLLAALDHPNIVSILTAERVDGMFFIVMEYVKGESLEAVLDREKSLDNARALNYAVQILKGVEHAHDAQILHRDLRPANVLISESGACKVADFGTSRLLERSHATTVIGSPPYMAPEAFQGRAVLASDIYSVGVMLYQMLTGVLPYFSPNPAQIERLVAQGRCTPPEAPEQPDPPRGLGHRDEGPRHRGDRPLPAGLGAPRRPRHLGRDRPQRDGDGGHPPPPPRPRGPEARLLLALPQAPSRPQRDLRLLRGRSDSRQARRRSRITGARAGSSGRGRATVARRFVIGTPLGTVADSSSGRHPGTVAHRFVIDTPPGGARGGGAPSSQRKPREAVGPDGCYSPWCWMTKTPPAVTLTARRRIASRKAGNVPHPRVASLPRTRAKATRDLLSLFWGGADAPRPREWP